jgi:hypothetical protein
MPDSGECWSSLDVAIGLADLDYDRRVIDRWHDIKKIVRHFLIHQISNLKEFIQVQFASFHCLTVFIHSLLMRSASMARQPANSPANASLCGRSTRVVRRLSNNRSRMAGPLPLSTCLCPQPALGRLRAGFQSHTPRRQLSFGIRSAPGGDSLSRSQLRSRSVQKRDECQMCPCDLKEVPGLVVVRLVFLCTGFR